MDVTPLSQSPKGEADPVAMISALLDAERVIPDEPKAEPEAQPETDAETGSNNAQVEGADVEQDVAPMAEIPIEQLEAIELETTYKGVDGKDVTEKLPIKALREGYMRQQDYQRKTAEVARQREEVGEKTRQAIDSERTLYLQQLQQLEASLIDTVAPELKNVDWNNLATNDPLEYIRIRNRADQVTQALNNIKSKQTEVKTKIEADKRQALEKAAQKTWATLESDIPGWNESLYKTLLSAGDAVGYKQEEVAQWVDARAIKLLHKAHLYDQMQTSKSAADKKVVSVPKVVKPGATQTVSKVVQQKTNAMEKLRKSGRVDDLAAMLATTMK